MEFKVKNAKDYQMDTQCVHAGVEKDIYGAVVTPIYQTSTFKFQDADHGARLFKGEEEGYIYTRMRNPTVEGMEKAIACLEGGFKAIGCASGMAASHLLFTATTEKGDHIICSESVYGPTVKLLNEFHKKMGIEVDFVDTSDPDAVRNAVRPNTKLIYV